MGPCKILRSLSFLRSSTKSSRVVPLSTQSSFKSLKLSFPKEKALFNPADLAKLVTSLKYVSKSVSVSVSDLKPDRVQIEEDMEEGVELLDICNFLVKKIENVRSYSESVKRAVSWKGAAPRVKELLDTKKYTGDDVAVEKCFARLKKLQRRRLGEDGSLTRSALSDVAEKCRGLNMALSFKKGRRGSSAGGCTGRMVELSDVIEVAKRMRDPTDEVDGDDVAKKCDVLGDVAGDLEEKVKEVYKELVSFRMVLLGIVSYC